LAIYSCMMGKRLPPSRCIAHRRLMPRRDAGLWSFATEFDAKPIEFESLLATVRRVLAKAK